MTIIRSKCHAGQINVLLWSTIYIEIALNFYRRNNFQEVFRTRNILIPIFPFDIIGMKRAMPVESKDCSNK